LFLSIKRADLSMLGTYSYIHEPPLDFPISGFGGTRDKLVTEESLAAWRAQTSAAFKLQMFNGEHFFIQSSRASLVDQINKVLIVYFTIIGKAHLSKKAVLTRQGFY